MKLKWSWVAATCVLAGILILVLPKGEMLMRYVIEYLIGIGLIVIGVLYFVVRALR